MSPSLIFCLCSSNKLHALCSMDLSVLKCDVFLRAELCWRVLGLLFAGECVYFCIFQKNFSFFREFYPVCFLVVSVCYCWWNLKVMFVAKVVYIGKWDSLVLPSCVVVKCEDTNIMSGNDVYWCVLAYNITNLEYLEPSRTKDGYGTNAET